MENTIMPPLYETPEGKTSFADGSYVYFIESVTLGPIKIGRARDPERRLAALQIGSPDKLRLVGTLMPPEPSVVEKRFHNMLCAHRSHGEWFHPHEEVWQVIRDALAPQAAKAAEEKAAEDKRLAAQALRRMPYLERLSLRIETKRAARLAAPA